MTFLPDSHHMPLMTEKEGQAAAVGKSEGEVVDVGGVPAVAYGGQGRPWATSFSIPDFAQTTNLSISALRKQATAGLARLWHAGSLALQAGKAMP
jgi:hypothetical protein